MEDACEQSAPHLRLCATRFVWMIVALIAWMWRTDLIGLIENHGDASLATHLFVFSILYVILAGLAVPGAVLLTLLAGPLFGMAWGTILTSFLSTLGASLAFLGSRHLQSQKKERLSGSVLPSSWWSAERLGASELFLLRLIPVVPFFALNVYAGRSHLSLSRFWIVSQIGMLPATFLLVQLGATLPRGTGVTRATIFESTWPLLLLGGVAGFVRWQTRIRLDRLQQPSFQVVHHTRDASNSPAKSRLLIFTVALLFISCARTPKRPLLKEIYSPVAQLPDYRRNPVILIPGILGSRLVDDRSGELVWGKFEQVRFFNRGSSGNMFAAALPMREGAPLSQLRDSIRSDGTLAYLEIDIAGVPVEIQAYNDILTSLGVGGYRDSQHPDMQHVDYGDDHFTCFQFDYDWRRDVSENAVRLHEFIEKQRQYIRQEYSRRYGIVNTEVKFDIVAHSMGGLLARYYLRYGPRPLPDDGALPVLDWAGARNLGRVVLVGTPNAGSALAIRDLVGGYHLSPVLPEYPAAVLGTMPATYQLLPRPRHGALVDAADRKRKLNIYDPDLWRDMKWGLASPGQDEALQKMLPDVADRDARLRIALDHQRKCLLRARQLHQALDIPASAPPGVTLHLFAGDSISTPSVVAVDLQNGELDTIKQTAGDDTTTRASAVMDERTGGSLASRLISPIHWTSTMFLHTSHRGLTNDPIFTDNVLALLLETPQSLEISTRLPRPREAHNKPMVPQIYSLGDIPQSSTTR